MNNDDQLRDDDIKNLITEYKANITIPEPSNWDNIQAEIIKHKKQKKRARNIKQLSSIAAAALLITVIFGTNNSSVTAQFSHFFKYFKNEITYVFLNKSDENRDKSSYIVHSNEDSPLYVYDDVREALSSLGFTPTLPKSIPADLVLDKVQTTIIENESDTFRITLNNANSDKVVFIDYMKISDKIGTIKDHDVKDENVTYEEILIGNYSAIVMNYENDRTSISWVTDDNVSISILSNLDFLTVHEIAISME